MGNTYSKVFVAVYLILEKEGKILLLRRCNTGYKDGEYSFIAGHVDENESAKQAIIREAKEEANLDLKENQLEVVHITHRRNPEREYIDIYLKAEKWHGEVKNMEPQKCDELKWFPKTSLPQNIVDDVQSALINIDKKNFYSEYGW